MLSIVLTLLTLNANPLPVDATPQEEMRAAFVKLSWAFRNLAGEAAALYVKKAKPDSEEVSVFVDQLTTDAIKLVDELNKAYSFEDEAGIAKLIDIYKALLFLEDCMQDFKLDKSADTCALIANLLDGFFTT